MGLQFERRIGSYTRRVREGTTAKLERSWVLRAPVAIALLRSAPVRQFGRFVLVGAGNTLISFVVYLALTEVGAPYAAAAPLAFCVGAANGYLWNLRWTFGARDSRRTRVLYVIIQAAGALVTSLLVVLESRVADPGRIAAYLIAVPPVTVCMFVANRVWTFANGPPSSGQVDLAERPE